MASVVSATTGTNKYDRVSDKYMLVFLSEFRNNIIFVVDVVFCCGKGSVQDANLEERELKTQLMRNGFKDAQISPVRCLLACHTHTVFRG